MVGNYSSPGFGHTEFNIVPKRPREFVNGWFIDISNSWIMIIPRKKGKSSTPKINHQPAKKQNMFI